DSLIPLDVYHHRLQDALLTTIDGADHPTGRRGIDHPWILLVAEQDLTHLHPVTDLDLHGRFHTMVVESHQRHAARRTGVFDALLWSAGHWQVQAPFELYHTNSLITFYNG